MFCFIEEFNNDGRTLISHSSTDNINSFLASRLTMNHLNRATFTVIVHLITPTPTRPQKNTVFLNKIMLKLIKR